MNEVARWITLQDPAFAVPLKGVAGRMVKELGLSATEAGSLLEQGIRDGAIALQDADTGYVMRPSPQVMATQIDWASGYLIFAGEPFKMLVVHWPDVERIARTKTTGPTIDVAASSQTPALPAPGPQSAPHKKRGPKGDKTVRAAAAMLADLRKGKDLNDLKQVSLAADYGVAPSTAALALKRARAQFNLDINSGN